MCDKGLTGAAAELLKQRPSCDDRSVEGEDAPNDLDHGLHETRGLLIQMPLRASRTKNFDHGLYEARDLTLRGERASLS